MQSTDKAFESNTELYKPSEWEKKQYDAALAVLFFLLLGLHGFAEPGLCDDTWFGTVLKQQSLLKYLIWRYETWSSRLILESFLVVLSAVHIWVWRFLDSLIVLWLIAILRELLNRPKTWQELLKISLILAFVPLGTLYSAGWIATTTNYLWPLTFGLYALLPVRRYLSTDAGDTQTDHPGQKQLRKVWEYVTFPAAALTAANQEQMAALLFGFYALFFVVVFTKKESPQKRNRKELVIPAVILGIAILSILVAVTCPGNEIRNINEITNWFPQYGTDYNLFEKLFMGYISTMSYYVAGIGGQFLLLTFTLILGFAVLDQVQSEDQSHHFIALGFAPAAAALMLGFFPRNMMEVGQLGRLSFYYDIFANRYLSQHDACCYKPWHVIFEGICFALLILWICALLLFLYRKTLAGLALILMLAGGYLSRYIVGLSATIYASGFRTCLFCTMTMFLTEISLLSHINNRRIKQMTYFLVCVLLAMTIYFETNGEIYK